MTGPEEQESQIVDPGFSPTLSPHSFQGAGHDVQDGDGSGGRVGSDNMLSDHHLRESEVQQDSIGSRVEETQFDILEPETQQFDEPKASLQDPTRLPQLLTADTLTSAVRPMSPPYAPVIERPKDLDMEGGSSGFKFGKAPPSKFGSFGRHPGRATEISPTRSNASGAASKQNPSPQVQPVAQRTPLPPKPSRNGSLPPSGKMKAPSVLDNGKHAGPPAEPGTPRTTPGKPVKQKDPEPSQPRASNVNEATYTSMPQSALPLEPSAKETRTVPQQPFPHKANPRAANKSNNRAGRKQACPPFPDVLQQPRGPSSKGRVPVPSRQPAATTIHPLQSVDVNSLLGDRISSKHDTEVTGDDIIIDQEGPSTQIDAINTSRSRQPCAISYTHNNPDHANSHAILPSVFNERDIQQEWPQGPDQLKQKVPHHHPASERGTLQGVDTPQSHMGHGDLPSESDGELQNPIQPISQPPSRSQSVISNTARSMLRPIVCSDLLPQGVPENSAFRSRQPLKIQKSNTRSAHAGQRVKSNPENTDKRPKPTSLAVQSFRQNWDQIEQALEDYERQKVLLESQQGDIESQTAALESQQKELEARQSVLESRGAEIEKLKSSIAESKMKIKVLKGEKTTLTTKVEKFKEISARYKTHMNDVVSAQNHLVSECTKMRTDSAKLREDHKIFLQLKTKRESHEERLRSLINSARSVRPDAEKMAALEEENTKYKTEIEKVGKTNVLLQSELNARILDLGRERHNTELLQKNLNAQTKSHKELVDALCKAQSTIVDELTKEGSLLANLVNSGNSIRAKIDELSAFVNTVNSREPDLPPPLIKLIEDIYTRIETKLQATENNEIGVNESTLKHFEDLKERINQLGLDDVAKGSLKDRISELRESNATLTASGSARDFECQALLKRIDELRREISECRDQLTVNSAELAALRALPKEDPIILGKIRDLENAKRILEGQVNSTNQESAKANEELVSCREAALSAQEQSQELQAKFTETQSSLKMLFEEKKKYLANHKAEIEKARQEVAKSAHASKTEAQLKHNSVAKNLEQRRSEAENELSLIQEELRKIQEENAGFSFNLTKVQKDLSACKKQLTQQAVYIKHAEQRNPTRDDFDRHEQDLQQARKGIADVRSHFDTAHHELGEKFDGAVSHHQQETEKLIRRVDSLEKENSAIGEQKSKIQKTHEDFKANVSQCLRRIGIVLGDQSVEEFVTAIPVQSPRKMGPPAVPILKPVPNQPSSASSASSDFTPSRPRVIDDRAFSSGLSGTPKEALQRNEQQQVWSAQRTASLSSTPSNNPRTKSLGTTGTPLLSVTKTAAESSTHFQPGSPYQSAPKPLRPAIRKRSGLAQEVQIEKKSALSTQIVDAPIPARDQASSSVKDQSIAAETPASMRLVSIGSFVTSSNHKSSSSTQPRASAIIPASSRDKGFSMTAQTPTDTLFSVAPMLPSSSPLSELELSMVDLLGYDDKEPEKAHIQGKELGNGRLINLGACGLSTPMQTGAASTVGGVVHFKTTPEGYQFSDEDGLSGVNKTKRIRPAVPSLVQESSRRREAKPLKSAMKASSKKKTTDSAKDAQNDIFQISNSTPVVPVSQKPTSRVPTNNKQQTQSRNSGSSIGSSYHRIASGSKLEASYQSSGVLSTAPRKSAANPIVSNSEKSPLMTAPARMTRKRSASMEANVQTNKPFKKPRVSLPNQTRRTSRDVIPDSQEAVFRS